MVLLDASQKQANRLRVLHNSCVRYLLGVRWNQHITPYREKLGWLCISTRRKYFMSLPLNIKNTSTRIFTGIFPAPYSQAISQGWSEGLEISGMSSDAGRDSFQYFRALFWNSLPASIRFLPPSRHFKVAVKNVVLVQNASLWYKLTSFYYAHYPSLFGSYYCLLATDCYSIGQRIFYIFK